MDPNAMAMAGGGGGGMPPMDQPTPGDQPNPGQGGDTDVESLMATFKQVVEQCLDGDGFVDMNRLITMWPQFSQVPFESVMQVLEQQPELFDQVLEQFGLSGITVNGKNMTLDELHHLGGGGDTASAQTQGGM